MKYEIVFTLSAESDLQLAVDWYENERNDSAGNFAMKSRFA